MKVFNYVLFLLLVISINNVSAQKNDKYSDTLYLKSGEKIIGREKAIYNFSFKELQEIKFCNSDSDCKKYHLRDIKEYKLNLNDKLIKKRHKFLLNKGNEENVDPSTLYSVSFNNRYFLSTLIYSGTNRDFYKVFYYTYATGKQKLIVRLLVTNKGEKNSIYSSRLDFGSYKNRLERHSEYFSSQAILDAIENKTYKNWDSDLPIFKLLDISEKI